MLRINSIVKKEIEVYENKNIYKHDKPSEKKGFIYNLDYLFFVKGLLCLFKIFY